VDFEPSEDQDDVGPNRDSEFETTGPTAEEATSVDSGGEAPDADEEADLDMSDFYDDETPSGEEPASSTPTPGYAAVGDVESDIYGEVDTSGVDADIAAPTVSIIGEPEELPRIVGSAHVVDAETLERDENDDVHAILRSVPGVYVRGEDGFGLRPNIGLRGVDSNRSSKITLMEDGILLGPAPYAAPAAYYFPLTTRMTGLEVFKGPAAVRHGPNTIGGAINLRTRDIPVKDDGGLDLAIGQRGYAKSHGFWGKSWKHFGVLLEGARIQSRGFKELDGGGETGFGKNEGMLKLRANLDPARRVYHQFDFKGGLSTERSHETYMGLSDADFETNPYRRYAGSQKGLMKWWRSQAQLSYLLAYDNLIEFQTTAYRNDFSRSWRKFNEFRDGPDIYDIYGDAGGQSAIYLAILRGEEDSLDSDQALLVGTNDRRYTSQGVQNLLRISPTTRYVDQTIELGVRFHHDTIRRNHTSDAFMMTSGVLVPDGGPSETTTLNRGTAYAGAIHLHDEVVILERLTVSPGARVELIKTEFDNDLDSSTSESFNAVFIPGIGAHVQATDWLGVLGGVHSGFSPVAPGQPDEVKPERSINYEGGLRLGGAPLGGFTGEAIGFFNDYSNLTGECTFAQGCNDANIGNQFNAGEVRVAGAELAAGFAKGFGRGAWLDSDASYTYTWSQFQGGFTSSSPQFGNVEAGDALPYLPVHVASLKLSGGMKRWGLWSTLAFNGQMRDLPGVGAIADDELVPRFLTLDLGGRVWVSPRASVYLNVMNVTGAEYMISRRPFGARPGRPRFGAIGFKYDFGGARAASPRS
jgi:Fe(3+) dicitrate transport protein